MAAKFSILTVAAIPLLPLIPLLACGGDDGHPIHVADAAHDSAGSGSGSQNLCKAQANYGTVTSFVGQAAKYTPGTGSDATTTLRWQGQLAGSAMDSLEVLIFGGCGSGVGSACGGTTAQPAGTPDWPTTFGPKANIDVNAQDVFVLVLANLNASTMKYQDIYLADMGTLNVTAASNTAGATFSGNVAGLAATHIDTSTFMPAADGCTTQVGGWSFSGSAAFQGKAGAIIDGAPSDEALRTYLRHRFQE